MPPAPGEALAVLDDHVEAISSHLMGTRAVRMVGTAGSKNALGDVVMEETSAQPSADDRKSAPGMDEEYQLRGLRRTVIEQVLRAVKQLRDCRTDVYVDTAESRKWMAALEALEAAAPESLAFKKTAEVAAVLKLKVPKAAEGTEEGALMHDMHSNLKLANTMSEWFKKPAELRAKGGVKGLFPDLQRDFSDITAPHVDTFDRAAGDGLQELLRELRGGLDAAAVAAVPRYFMLTLKDVTDRRRGKDNGLHPRSGFKTQKAWDAAGGGVIDRVEAALLTPDGAMVVKFTRISIVPYGWLLSIERNQDDAADAEKHGDPLAHPSRKKRLQALMAQKPVEEREAGGVRRVLDALLAALENDATPVLTKVYAKAELTDAMVGWDADRSDAPALSPCGRAALQLVFSRWAHEFVDKSTPETREVRRELLAEYAPWLENLAGAVLYDAQGKQVGTPATDSAASLTKPPANGRASGKKRKTRDPVPERLSAVARAARHAGVMDEDGHSSCDDGEVGFNTVVKKRKKTRVVTDDVSTAGTMRSKASKQYVRGTVHGDAFEGIDLVLRNLDEVVPAEKPESDPIPEGKKFGGRTAVRDPGLPPGGVEGLRKLYQVLMHTPGSPLQPSGRRLHKLDYTAPLLVQVTYSYTVGSRLSLFECKDWIYAGEVPVMVRSKACVLAEKTSRELATVYGEESREAGGYFIMAGNERVLRMVLASRGNHAITLERGNFSNKGASFTSKCVFMRSVKPSGIAIPNYLYMLSSGKIILSFSRGSTWQVPLSLVLLSLCDGTTPLQLAQRMSSDPQSDKWVAAFMGDVFNQVQLARHYVGIADDCTKPGFPSCAEHWQYALGRYLCNHKKVWVREVLVRCRAKLEAGSYSTEVYRMVGLWAVREHVLPHLNTPEVEMLDAKDEREAKLTALIVMVKKLVMFQSGRLREEGEDGLVNQEVITPGQLWLHSVMDGLLAVGRSLRSSLSMLGLTDNAPREGWEALRPGGISELLAMCAGRGEVSLRELMWSYFWRERRAGGGGRRGFGKRGDDENDARPSYLLPLELDADGNPIPGAKAAASTRRVAEGGATYWKMRFDTTEEDEDAPGDKKGNRQRVLREPTYPVRFMCSTGNYTQEPLIANGASLPQTSGWSVVVERINQFRLLEQFRATHRGKTIQEMRTTTPRRYRMDGWGFLCIVHTPDGGPCGVMNHLTYPTQVVVGATRTERAAIRANVLEVLGKKLKDERFSAGVGKINADEWYPVSLDAEIIGYVHKSVLAAKPKKGGVSVGSLLRELRCTGVFPNSLEIVTVDPDWVESRVGRTGVTKDVEDFTCKAPRMTPGVSLFSGPGRLSRPVKKLGKAKFEKGAVAWIGTQEQIFLDIAALHKDVGEARVELGKFEYIEVSTTSALSLSASLIPYFEMNCSPRNLFQCGMAKQTMGSCFHSVARRSDNKLYHTHACQAALLRTDNQHIFRMDDYPNGINVVLAVASYTGFDMEDALLINKSSVERGLFQGSVYISTILEPFAEGVGQAAPGFTRLPLEGEHLTKGTVYAEFSNGKKEFWSKAEAARVHNVEILAMDAQDRLPIRVRVIFRLERTPVVGDKFAARHGQKGTLPVLIPQHEMPFSDEGVCPDVIINPHAFPSRMTVGMLIEMIAAKFAAVKGTYPDATAWSEISDRPIHSTKIGDLLGGLGYSHTGAQMLTHGATGQQMQCDIYMGICYYQRLRHMVSDKYQARERADRATAGIDPLTGQPVKGRKKGGGIRVGEMERDALIAHGTIQVGQDRLLKSSDLGVMRTCAACCANPCTCEDGGIEQYRFAPKALAFMNAQLRTMGVTVRTTPA
eukprot:TRINITY_DN27403_c0_g1_i1.p1 TRINITY_DN27403_c0_g1~~TRINITY_DN27403_c0_g1_i1.p1  ORF type:complete len:1821 (+),score=560.99 TRINITY_DN27403_c0_g1_i1:131-5593(+)